MNEAFAGFGIELNDTESDMRTTANQRNSLAAYAQGILSFSGSHHFFYGTARIRVRQNSASR